MSWILICILLGSLALAGMALMVYLRRTQRKAQLELRREAWELSCSRTDPEETLLVVLCCERHGERAVAEELRPTVDALFERASCPNRVRVGLVTSEGALDAPQTLFPDGDSDRESAPHASLFVHQVRTCGEPAAQGPSPARALALERLVSNERYVMLLHSRATVEDAWDTRIVADLRAAGEHSVVSTLLQGWDEGEDDEELSAVVAVADVDADGFPLLQRKPMARAVTGQPRRTLLASPTLLALRRADIRPHSLGTPALAGLRGDADAFGLTLALRLAGMRLVAPSRRLCLPSLRRKLGTDRDEPPEWQQDMGRYALQALVAAVGADRKLLEVKDDDDAVLAVLTALPWVGATLGSALMLPGLVEALEAAHERNRPEDPGHQALLHVAAQSIDKARQLVQKGQKMYVADVLEAGALVRHADGQRLHPEDWKLVLRTLADANRAAVLAWVEMPGDVGDVLDFMGLDLRRRTLAGRAVLGLPPGKMPREEMLDRFGSEAAYQRERARWTFE